MADEYGLTANGFVVKPFAVIADEIKSAMRNAFGRSLRLDARSIFGQIVNIFAEREFLVWQLAEAVNAAQDPDAATGAALDALAVLTGTFRPQASSSVVALTLMGDDATVVPSGTACSTTSTGARFVTLADATLALADTWTALTNYFVGDVVSNGGQIYLCTQDGTSAGATGPVNTDTRAEETDSTVKWVWLGAGEAFAVVDSAAQGTGPIPALAYDLENIEDAVGGLSSVVNQHDATEGRDQANDDELRILREAELAAGKCTTDAITSALLRASQDIVAVTVFSNDTDVTDVDGVPPHAVEALVRVREGSDTGHPAAPVDQIIFDTLLANVAAGIKTHGTTSGTAVDSQGTAHTVKFSHPDEINIYVAVTLVKDPDAYPIDGDAQVKDAIVKFGDRQKTGKNAVAASILAQVFTVDGVLDASVAIGTAPGPTLDATIQIALRELAVFDSSRITVSSSDGTP